MGSGKTEVLIRNLKPILEDEGSILMLSCRQTLSTEWMARYQRAGLTMIDYRQQKGLIEVKQGAITVCQVDSVQRIKNDDI